MGLSLRNVGKKITDILGGAERQINPFDNGATYSKPNPITLNNLNSPVAARPAPVTLGSSQSVLNQGLGQPNPTLVPARVAGSSNFKVNLANATAPTKSIAQIQQPSIASDPNATALQSVQNVIRPVAQTVNRNLVQPVEKNAIALAKSVVHAPDDVFNSLLGRSVRQAADSVAAGANLVVGNKQGADKFEKAQASNIAGGKVAANQGAQQLVAAAKAGQLVGESFNEGGLPDPKLTPGETAKNLISAKSGAKPTPKAKVTSVDKAIKQELNSRPDNLKKIEQSKVDMSDAERLKLSGGDTGQAGLQLGASDRDALLAKFKAQASAEGKPVVNLKNSELPKDNPLYIDPKTEVALNQSKAALQDGLDQSAKVGERVVPDEVPKGLGTDTRRPADVNTALNPHKSLVADVQPHDFDTAIANSQVVSRPIDLARQQWENSVKKLAPEERTNFWRSVEDPKNVDHSPALQKAISRWREVDNMVHANSQALGGNTNYITDHALHPWQLPEEFTQHIINGGNATDFGGINNISRKYGSIAEGEQNGLTLGTDPLKEGSNYLQASSASLRKAALKQGLEKADVEAEARPFTRDLGNGHTVQLSREGFDASQGVQYYKPSDNPIVKGLRTANQTVKSTILSGGQFHTINIGALRAAPTLILEGHPLAAAQGLYGMFRGAFGTEYADNVLGKAITDGTVEKAAQIGMPYGSKGYATEGTFLKNGIGEKTVFGKQIPIMHDQVARSIISDLEAKGIPLDSDAARAAGKAGSHLMGEVNKEAQNIPPQVSQALSDTLLASQFTHSKFAQLKSAVTEGGVSGSYARANVAANVAATLSAVVGIGALAHQKSDDLKDMFLRALVDPAAPTPVKDSKGNTVKLRLPGSDTSDIAKIIGIKLVRNKDNHLGISWNPKNLPGTVTDFARARLSPFLSSAVKVATNTTFADKPLFDPNAQGGTKVEQAATSIGTGLLPIGLQGLPYVKAIEKHLPGKVQEVLNAQTPGTNPLAKSIGSSFGVTPSTDMTTGQGLDTSRYFDTLDKAKQGLNRQEADALDLYSGSKKNPVTGKYDVQPSVNDQRAKATSLLQNGKVIDRLITANKTLSGEGQAVDPLWKQPKDKIVKYLQYQAMPPDGPDQKDWRNKNPWYESGNNSLQDQRSKFFDSLPPGDPNKPKAPIEYPQASPDVQKAQNTYFKLSDSSAKASYINSHPELQDQFDKQSDYYNKLRTAQGYAAFKDYPKASPSLQSFITAYNAADKSTRKGIRTANPDEYQKMAAYYDSASLYNIGSDASVSQLQGEPDATQKELKNIKNLSQDIYQNADSSYSINPAAWLTSGSSGSGGGSYSGKVKVKGNYGSFAKRTGKAKAAKKVAVSARSAGGSGGSSKSGNAKVSIKKSLV